MSQTMTITVKCERCGGKATGNTFEEAEGKVNHDQGRSRGIKCSMGHYQTIEVDPKTFEPKDVKDRRCVTCGQHYLK